MDETVQYSRGMDQPVARPARWRRYSVIAGLGLLGLGIAVWLLKGMGHSTYRIPVDRLSLGTVTRGRFDDFISIRATAAPFNTQYLTADQGAPSRKSWSKTAPASAPGNRSLF